MSNVPCSSCPWRRGSSAKEIPTFCIIKARNLRNTVGDEDDFRTVMACHGTDGGKEHACIGYVATQGYSNLNVRLMAFRGEIDLPAIWEAAKGLDLYETFDEMLDNLEATVVP